MLLSQPATRVTSAALINAPPSHAALASEGPLDDESEGELASGDESKPASEPAVLSPPSPEDEEQALDRYTAMDKTRTDARTPISTPSKGPREAVNDEIEDFSPCGSSGLAVEGVVHKK